MAEISVSTDADISVREFLAGCSAAEKAELVAALSESPLTEAAMIDVATILNQKRGSIEIAQLRMYLNRDGWHTINELAI